uniref:Uncharacterized protein n=1 Tax=candidate division CPR3 bacterium TaxID=2268181 RepID=A0A7C4R8C5_UNCC3
MDQITATIHKGLTLEKWSSLGLDGMLGNIGSETYRALQAKKQGNKEKYLAALGRALELIDLTSVVIIQGDRPSRAYEIGRLREIVADAYDSGDQYPDGLEYADKYCMDFAIRSQKSFIATRPS